MRRIAAEAAVEHVDDRQERAERRIGRPRKVDRFRPLVEQLLQVEGLPGEFSQHDFGQVRLRYLDGTHAVVEFFGSRLMWSRWAAVDLVDGEDSETLVRTVAEHFVRFDRVPLCAVFDRPKTVVRWSRKSGQVVKV